MTFLIILVLPTECGGCQERQQLQKIRPCGHRICSNCALNIIARTCPACREEIDTYLPPHLMGGEIWADGIPEELERQFHLELLRQDGFTV